MIVKNPTKEYIEIMYQGTTYAVEALSEVSVPAEVAEYWQTNLHQFLIVSKEKEVKAAAVTIAANEPIVITGATAGLVSIETTGTIGEPVVTTTDTVYSSKPVAKTAKK